jgi:hypothetical protein
MSIQDLSEENSQEDSFVVCWDIVKFDYRQIEEHDLDSFKILDSMNHPTLLANIKRCVYFDTNLDFKLLIPVKPKIIHSFSHASILVVTTLKVLVHLISLQNYQFKVPPVKSVQCLNLIELALRIAIMVCVTQLNDENNNPMRQKSVLGNEGQFGKYSCNVFDLEQHFRCMMNSTDAEAQHKMTSMKIWDAINSLMDGIRSEKEGEMGARLVLLNCGFPQAKVVDERQKG